MSSHLAWLLMSSCAMSRHFVDGNMHLSHDKLWLLREMARATLPLRCVSADYSVLCGGLAETHPYQVIGIIYKKGRGGLCSPGAEGGRRGSTGEPPPPPTHPPTRPMALRAVTLKAMVRALVLRVKRVANHAFCDGVEANGV